MDLAGFCFLFWDLAVVVAVAVGFFGCWVGALCLGGGGRRSVAVFFLLSAVDYVGCLESWGRPGGRRVVDGRGLCFSCVVAVWVLAVASAVSICGWVAGGGGWGVASGFVGLVF